MEFDGSTTWGDACIDHNQYHTGRHLGGANVAFIDGHVKFYRSGTSGMFYKNPTADWESYWEPAVPVS
jgi:prepilin-type processing-associated H-X9-DG protein